jgi:hypothetical protein
MKFEYNSLTAQYLVNYRGIEYVLHSPVENTFYFDEDIKIYDSKTAKTVIDTIKVLKVNSRPGDTVPLGDDLIWQVYKKYVEVDGYTNNTKVYVTYADSDGDGIPDDPRLFEILVNPQAPTAEKYIFFKSESKQLGTNRYVELTLVPRSEVVINYATRAEIVPLAGNFRVGQVFYAYSENLFYSIIPGISGGANTLSTSPLANYIAYIGRQDLYYQYKHNSPNTRRINPNISNIIDMYILTADYNTSYRQWLQDTSNSVQEPTAPTPGELEIEFQNLKNFKTLSDTMLMQSAEYMTVFGVKANSNLQATFKIVKNPNLNISDSEIKSSVVSAINTYFQIENWDFGESFYFSELAAYLHKVLSPNIASIIIVPKDPTIKYGILHQINAEPNEIIVSSATVDDVEIISAVTANQLNQGVI